MVKCLNIGKKRYIGRSLFKIATTINALKLEVTFSYSPKPFLKKNKKRVYKGIYEKLHHVTNRL